MKKSRGPVLSFSAPWGCTAVQGQELFSPTAPGVGVCRGLCQGKAEKLLSPNTPIHAPDGEGKASISPPTPRVPSRHKPNPAGGQKPSLDPPSPSALQVLEQSLERGRLFLMLQQQKNTTKLNMMVCEMLLGV